MWLLAQDVDKAIGWADRASQLGVAGLALLIMLGTLFVAYWQYRQNAKLSADYVTKVEALLREMLDRGDDAQEIQSANTQANKDMAAGMGLMANEIKQLASQLSQLVLRTDLLERGLDPRGRSGHTQG